MPPEASLILVVDDDEDFLEISRVILESEGYRVVGVSDPQTAWEQMDSQSPDLIISDLMMGHLDSGFGFSKKVKSDPRFKDVPILLVTAVTSQCGYDFHPRGQEELAAMCVDAYLDKPVLPRRLLEKVAELLNLNRNT